MIAIILGGALLRFYHLGWGSPFFFHPDERNIAGSISQMFWGKTYNPHFFAYGSFWSYIVLFLINSTDFLYKIGNIQILEFIKNIIPQDPFSRAIVFLRFFSALQGIGTIMISYFVAKILFNKYRFLAMKQQGNGIMVLLLPFLIATSPGLIQASHFGTFESSLTFLYFLIFYLCLKSVSFNNSFFKHLIFYILSIIVFGITLSIRVTSFILTPAFLIVIFFVIRREISFKKKLFKLLILAISSTLIPSLIFILSNPYSVKPFNLLLQLSSPFSSDFLSTMNYESGVAMGTIPVFYTQQFQNTTPILYQFTKVLPYVLNPVIYLLFFISLIYIFRKIFSSFLNKQRSNLPAGEAGGAMKQWFFLFIFFLITFIPNSTLYVKWTRYIIPSLPFIYIFVFLLLLKINGRLITILVACLSFIFAVFFTTVYSSDNRVEAAKWAKVNLKQNSKILSEIYDMGIVPFNEIFHYSQIQLFNFYDLDDKNIDELDFNQLKQNSIQADVIILPSKRIMGTRLRLPKKYPNGFWFYDSLRKGQLSFRLEKTFTHPYDKIIPGFSPDESFTVFDHPSVEIYEK